MDWNYMLLDGVNDSEKNAAELCSFLEKGDTVKLTVLSPVQGISFMPSDKIVLFKKMLEERGVRVRLFEPNGKDIGAACGQMTAKHYEKGK